MIAGWALVIFAVFLIGLAKSGLGAGMGLIVVPLTVIGLDQTSLTGAAALGFLLPLLIIGDVISVSQYRRHFDLRAIKRLLIPAAIGIAVGYLILNWIHDQDEQALIAALIRLEIGLESILLVGLTWWRNYRGQNRNIFREPSRSWITGSFAGLSSTLAHAAGPVIAMYLLPLKLPRQSFVGTAALFFFLVNGAKIPAYVASGQFESIDLRLTALFLPLVVGGALTGFWLLKRITDQAFVQIVLWATFLLGVYLLIDSAVRLANWWG